MPDIPLEQQSSQSSAPPGYLYWQHADQEPGATSLDLYDRAYQPMPYPGRDINPSFSQPQDQAL